MKRTAQRRRPRLGWPVVASSASEKPHILEKHWFILRMVPARSSSKMPSAVASRVACNLELMLANSWADVIGCHPLFGPGVGDASGGNVILCKARGRKWIGWLRNILEKNGLVVTEETPEEHDKIMAIVQVLNHLSII